MNIETKNRAVRVACDVGGTFTDICVLNEMSGRMHVAKVPTTPDPIEGVLAGIEAGGVDLKDLVLFSHGTTLATNALITRRFPPAVMITTKGFRDTIEIRRGNRDDLWDTYKEMAKPYIRRRDRLVVTERVDYSGAVVTPLDADEAREIARIVKKRGVKTVRHLLRQCLHEPRQRAADARHPGSGIARCRDLAVERDHAGDFRA